MLARLVRPASLGRLNKPKSILATRTELVYTDPANLPFKITRANKGLSLPVYHDIRNGRTRHRTILRKYDGDTKALAEELSVVVGNAEVFEYTGRLEVAGNKVHEIRGWLQKLGF